MNITNKPQNLDVIIPVYNEELLIEEFYERLSPVIRNLQIPTRLIYVDDGSTDNTFAKLQAIANQDGIVTIIKLSRNFGHQVALTAGLDITQAEIVITMDGDGQHPPELIPDMIALYFQGFDVIQAKRISYANCVSFKGISSKFFYWIINILGDTRIEQGTSDFRLLSKQVVSALNQVHDYHKFIRGTIPWLGFKEKSITYEPKDRIAGKSKYTLSKMLRLAENAVFSFSIVPLRIGLIIGLLFFIFAIIEAIYVVSFWIAGKQNLLAPGWSSIVFLILITGGSLMVIISVLGFYIGQISQQVKGRPLYIIQEIFKGNRNP